MTRRCRPAIAALVVALAGGCTGDAATAPVDAAGGVGGSAGTGDGAGGAGGTGNAAPGAGADPAIAMIQAQAEAAAVDRARPDWRTRLPAPTAVGFTPGKTYVWQLTTDKGELTFHLRPDVAPMHATSTIYLTLLGFYDTLTFHRIIKGFMAQGGDPLGTGSGSPGYRYGIEVSPAAKHDGRGILSMANAGANTEGSQFFVTFAAQPALDGKYSVFGKLVSGLETLAAIEAGGTAGEGRPTIVQIMRATIAVE